MIWLNVLLRHFVLAWTAIVSLDCQHALRQHALSYNLDLHTHICLSMYTYYTHIYIYLYIYLYISTYIYKPYIHIYIIILFFFFLHHYLYHDLKSKPLNLLRYYTIYIYYSIFSLWSTENAKFMPVVYHTWIDSHCSILVCSFVP